MNAGRTHRLGVGFTYVELDPWFVLGGTLGAGLDDQLNVHPVVGIWEGFPLVVDSHRHCDEDLPRSHFAMTLAIGYRYTGVHELYTTIKAGAMFGESCWD
ncbi:MAG: hypothetical protein AB7O24_07465 [Kofleriaceae bacterium]